MPRRTPKGFNYCSRLPLGWRITRLALGECRRYSLFSAKICDDREYLRHSLGLCPIPRVATLGYHRTTPSGFASPQCPLPVRSNDLPRDAPRRTPKGFNYDSRLPLGWRLTRIALRECRGYSPFSQKMSGCWLTPRKAEAAPPLPLPSALTACCPPRGGRA